MALGAQPRDILSMVVRDGVALALVGVGLAASVVLTRLMSSLLYEVSATAAGTWISPALSYKITSFSYVNIYFGVLRW